MQDSGIIPAYVDMLAGKLSFNASLSLRVRREIEDHLWEAVARDGNRGDSQQRAVASFGDPQVIASQFATAWLAKQTQKASLTIVVIIACVFVAMKARIAWYDVTQWGLREEAAAVAQTIAFVDACAFWVSVIMGIAGLAYLVVRRAPAAALYSEHRRQLRRALFLSIVSVAALIVSVLGDGALTILRLMGRELSPASLVPIASMAIEIGCAGIVIHSVRSIVERMAQTTALLET